MSVKRMIVAIVALAVLPLSVAFGAGGVSWGEQCLLPEYPELANYDTQARFTAVYGYSVARGGMRNGGFALGVHTPNEECSLDGGFIGAISGQELRAGPFVIALNLWTGIGGVRRTFSASDGTFALFGQADLELGFSLFPGMRVVGYGGMQAVADVLAWHPVSTAVYYTPVAGIRLAWGR
jgi:hypothetical protein